MNIDDIADSKTDQASPGERFYDEWLSELPRAQWPAYIDDSAQLVTDGVLIGNTELTSADFPYETGKFYHKGLAESANIDPEATSLPLGNHSHKDIGIVAWAFNQLREEIRSSRYTDFKNPSRAIEAAINKAVVEQVERGGLDASEVETIRLPEDASVSTLVTEIFCRPRSETYLGLLLETVSETATSGLLNRIEEPRMVTPLWDHQREALDRWLAHDCRGYVDMATATGKTFLGLAAIAHHFGALHPEDRDLADDRFEVSDIKRATVVIIAHRDLILDQWKREFDTHLNIPEQSSIESGEDTVEFEWGDVHFWTPGRLQNATLLEETIDLVVLDETHHYLGSSGFGSILDDLDGHLLALSGSLDDANVRTLERRNIPEIFEFSLRDGQQAGVIPQCDWDVILTPYDNQAQLAEVTERCRRGFERYSDGISVPGDVDADTDTLEFETLSEARSIAQTTVGRELKERDEDFRDFSSAVMARQLTKYNLSPELSSVTRLVLDKADRHKCVVLLESEAEIETVTTELQARLGEDFESLITVFDGEADLSVVREFDSTKDHGAIIGQARTLGEGVDIETADVCINRGRGRLSRSLIQRMGRILRNPDGDKHAQFYHISGLPTRIDAVWQREDGAALLETSSQMLEWGESFNARPVFEIDGETELQEDELTVLESNGAEAIEEWTPDHFEWPVDGGVKDHLQALCKRVLDEQHSVLLSLERAEREDESGEDEIRDESESTNAPRDDGLEFIAAQGRSIETPSWLYELISEAASEDPDRYIEDTVRRYAKETITFPSVESVPKEEYSVQIALNPALEAVLTSYVTDGSIEAAVFAALVKRIEDDVEDLATATDVDKTVTDIKSAMEAFT